MPSQDIRQEGGQTGGQRQQSGEGTTGLGGQVGSGGLRVQAGWFRLGCRQGGLGLENVEGL